MPFRFDCVFYYVSDLERAVGFYRDVLGLALRSRDFVARFELDGILVELVPSTEARVPGTGHARLTLGVDDMDAAVAELRRRGIPVTAPERKANGVLACLHDPDGNEICLWQYSQASCPPPRG